MTDYEVDDVRTGENEYVESDDEIDLLAVAAAPGSSNRNLHWNFIAFSILFSITHASVDCVLSFTSSELGSIIGSYSGFLLYATYTITALLFSKLSLKMFTSKFCVFFGLVTLLIYIFTFMISLFFTEQAMVVFLIGAALGGVGAGVLWTAQGSYYSLSATQYAIASGQDDVKIKNYFSAIFAISYLSLEAALTFFSTAVFSLMAAVDPDSPSAWKLIVFPFYLAIATFAVFGFYYFVYDIEEVRLRLRSLSSQDEQQRRRKLQQGNRYTDAAVKICNRCGMKPHSGEEVTYTFLYNEVSAVTSMMYRNRRLQLMIPFQVSFGLMTGLVNYYVNSAIVVAYIGDGYIGSLMAVAIVSAALLTWPLAVISNYYTYGKWCIMIFGGCAFFFNSVTLLLFSDATMGNWAFLIIYFLIHGASRSIWESTNKSVIAEYFVTDSQRDCAFAAVSFTNGVASSFAFLCYQFMSRFDMALLNTVWALVSIACYHMSTLVPPQHDAALLPLSSPGLSVTPRSDDIGNTPKRSVSRGDLSGGSRFPTSSKVTSFTPPHNSSSYSSFNDSDECIKTGSLAADTRNRASDGSTVDQGSDMRAESRYNVRTALLKPSPLKHILARGFDPDKNAN